MRYRIGLNIGAKSCGWSVIQHDTEGNPIRIENLGVRMFEIAETPKDGSPLAKARRETRSIRRRVRRRQHRIERTKKLLLKYNLITETELLRLYNTFENIYELRVTALDEQITNTQLAKILLKMVKKRGYKSNVQLEDNINDEDGKVLTATKDNQKIMKDKGYRTVAEMYLKDTKFKVFMPNNTIMTKIRNTTGSYNSTVLRYQIRDEILLILNTQAKFNSLVTNEFISDYINIFDSQRNFDEGSWMSKTKQVEKMLGKCIFEKQENRAVQASYSFEYFSLLKQLNNIIIEKNTISEKSKQQQRRKLTAQERKKIVDLVKYQSVIRYSDIRQELGLDKYERFANIDYKSSIVFSESINRESERKIKLEGFSAYFRIKQALYFVDSNLIDKLSITELNTIAYILTVYKSNERRIEQFHKSSLMLSDSVIHELLKISFVDIAYLSLKAINKLIPYLEQGYTYKYALNAVYPIIETDISKLNEEILNPIQRKAISQTLKVLKAIINKYGKPDFIAIDFEDNLNQTRTERDSITKLKKENQLRIDKIKQELEVLGIENPSGKEIAKYKLWKSQSEYCIYSGKKIPIEKLFTDEIDINYIIPFNMCFDDTYKNKVVTFTSEIKAKENMLPYNYIRLMKRDIEDYETRVIMLTKNYNKQKLLLKSTIERDEMIKWRNRNIENTQYIGKWLNSYITKNVQFTDCEKYSKKIILVNKNLSTYISKKIDLSTANIASDTKYAINATVTATVSNDIVHKIIQYNNTENMQFPLLWPSFREDISKLPEIPISRDPKRKARGEAHDETKRRLITTEKGFKCISRVELKKLKLNSQGEIDGYAEHAKQSDLPLYNALKEKITENGGNVKSAFILPMYKPNRKYHSKKNKNRKKYQASKFPKKQSDCYTWKCNKNRCI